SLSGVPGRRLLLKPRASTRSCTRSSHGVTLSHTMSLVQKIPPMVSALAFGYGVGMAAPQSTISSVEAAVVAYHEAPRQTAQVAPAQSTPAPRVTARGIGGDESRELARLREAVVREAKRGDRGETCDLDPPSFSKAPRYESRMDRETLDADD